MNLRVFRLVNSDRAMILETTFSIYQEFILIILLTLALKERINQFLRSYLLHLKGVT